MGWKDTITRNAPAKKSWRDTIKTEPKEPSAFDSAITGAAQGATLGLADELAGAIGGVGDYISQGGKLDLEDYYKIRRDLVRKEDEKARESNPKSFMAGNIGGGLATAMVPGLGALNAGKGATLATQVGKGALQGGISGAGYSNSEDSKEILEDAAIGAGIGGALPIALKGVGMAANKIDDITGISDKTKSVGNYIKDKIPSAKTILKKGGKIFANVDEDVTDDYLQRADDINASEATIEGLKGDVDKVIASTRDNVGKAKDSLKVAEENAVRGLENKDSTAIREGITGGIDKLKQKVIAGSNKAYQSLDELGDAVVETKDVLGIINKSLDDLKVNGKIPTGDAAKKSYSVLSNLEQNLAEHEGSIPVKEVKKIIQQLDADDIFSDVSGSFSPQADAAKVKVRQAFNEKLRGMSPTYAKIMDGVSDDTKLLKELSKGYGKDEQLFARLDGLQSAKGKAIEMPRLDELQNKTGTNFKNELSDYLESKFTLKDPTARRQAMEALPESKLYKEALEVADNITGWSEMNSEARLKALMGNRNNIENKETLDFISKLSKKDIATDLKNIKAQNAFTKADTNGSRKTLMGALAGRALEMGIGGGLGYAASDSPYGAMMGAAAGLGADKYSGQIFKKVLDGYLKGGKFASSLSQELGPYAKILMDAASRGNKNLALTHQLLLQKDDNYKKTLEREMN